MNVRAIKVPAGLVELLVQCDGGDPQCYTRKLPGGAVSVVLLCDRDLVSEADAMALLRAQANAIEGFAAQLREAVADAAPGPDRSVS